MLTYLQFTKRLCVFIIALLSLALPLAMFIHIEFSIRFRNHSPDGANISTKNNFRRAAIHDTILRIFNKARYWSVSSGEVRFNMFSTLFTADSALPFADWWPGGGVICATLQDRVNFANS